MNHYWRHVGSKVLISKAGRAYRKRVSARAMLAMMTARCRTLDGSVAVMIWACPPDRRRRDLDNILKPLLDALQHAGCYRDDSQIDDLHVTRMPEKPPAGTVTVTIDGMEE